MCKLLFHVPWEAFSKTSANFLWFIFHSIFWILATLNFWLHALVIFWVCFLLLCVLCQFFHHSLTSSKTIHTRDCALFIFQMTKPCTRYRIPLCHLKIPFQCIENSYMWFGLILDSLVYFIWSYTLKYGFNYSNFVIIY